MKKSVLCMFVVAAMLVTACKGEKKESKDAVKEVKTEVEKESSEVKMETSKAKEMMDGKTEEATKTMDDAKKMATDKVDEAKEMIKSALDGVEIPSFKNEAVTKHLQSYASYAKEYIAGKGDVLKNAKLAKQGIALATKGKELLGTLDAEETSKFNSVMSAIQSKMAPAK